MSDETQYEPHLHDVDFVINGKSVSATTELKPTMSDGWFALRHADGWHEYFREIDISSYRYKKSQ